jgi:CRP-like cAMP-binding protein
MATSRKARPQAGSFAAISVREFTREFPGSSKIGYAAGEPIFQEGSKADACFIVLKGRVAIMKKTRQGLAPIATAGPGEFLGEMAMLSGEKRSASASAKTPVVALRITYTELVAGLRAENPFAGRVALQLSTLLARRCSRLLKLIARQPQIVLPGHRKIVPLHVQGALQQVYTLLAV